MTCTVTAILTKVRVEHKEPFYDMQVLGTNNYVTADGLIHHNSGKSSILGKRTIASALHNAPVPVMLVSPSYRMAKRTIIPTIMSLLHGRNVKYDYQRADAMIQVKVQGRTGHIWIGSGDVPDSLKGANLAAVLVDEAFQLPLEVIEILLSRIRDPKAQLRELCLVGTMDQGVSGWAYDIMLGDKKQDFDLSMHQASTLENKALPPEFVKTLLAAYDEKTAAAYVHGKFVNLSSGRIYGAFDRDEHVKPCQPPPGAEVIAGVDFNVDPACAVLMWVDDDDVVHYFDEVYMTGGHDTYELADEVWATSKSRLTTFYPDPSGIQRKTSARVGITDITILQQAGIRLRGMGQPFQIRARRRTPVRRDRYNAMNGMFRANKIEVDPKCPHLIKSLLMSTYEGFSKHDGYDHICDAASYYAELTNPVMNKIEGMRRWHG